VENEKTTRRYLRKNGYSKSFNEVIMLPLNEHTTEAEIGNYQNYLLNNTDCGLMSEAGVPAVADPGHSMIRKAHENNIRVIPLVGPSAIILALMASGLNGQSFCFNGYVPVKQPARNKTILTAEQNLIQHKNTQIFIETPYRNNLMINDILHVCNPSTLLCIAADLTGKNEYIETRRIGEWRKRQPSLEKIPAIFLIGRA
jgi:16S rRNA (cytidine1402-2'-O)-methyltransferase